MTSRPKVVFLSYAHADEEKVAHVYECLRKAGFDPWMDKFSLTPGSEWRTEIDKAIRRSGAFLSLISTSSLDRGGILRGEMKLALDLRGERLDDRGLLIPVRLEHCPLPQELRHLQALDWYLPEGPAKLIASLASVLQPPSFAMQLRRLVTRGWVLAGVGLILAGLGIGAWKSMSRVSPYEVFLRSRPGAPVVQPPSQPAQIGVTVWRVSEDNATGSGVCGFLRFTRQPLGQPVRTGERLRLDVQASRPGYIYVISREIEESNRPGPAQLLFPVNSVNSGNNRIVPGSALLIPPASDMCSTLQLTHAGAAEQISVLFSESVLNSLPTRDTPYVIGDAVEAGIARSAVQCAQESAPVTTGQRDVELPDSEARNLAYTSAGPDAVFTSDRMTGPAMATFTLRTLK